MREHRWGMPSSHNATLRAMWMPAARATIGGGAALSYIAIWQQDIAVPAGDDDAI